MIRSHSGEFAAMHVGAGDSDRRIDKYLIQFEERQKAWMRPFAPCSNAVRRIAKLRSQQPACASRKPIVEVADQNAGAVYVAAQQNLILKKSLRLSDALQIVCSEMRVEDVKPCAADHNVYLKTSSRLAMVNANVVIAMERGRQSCKNGVAVFVFAVLDVRAVDAVHPESVCDETSLMRRASDLIAEDFLQSDHVRIDLAKHIDDPFGQY